LRIFSFADNAEPYTNDIIGHIYCVSPRLQVVSIDKPDEAEDLVGHDDAPGGGGVVYWARQNDAGDTEILPGDSETLTIRFRVADDVPADTSLARECEPQAHGGAQISDASGR
jgi:hypothetical protein